MSLYRRRFWAVLKALQARLGMAILFITHDLGIVRKMVIWVCVMRAGEIVEAGAVTDLFANPQHPYTRRLLAAEPQGEPPPERIERPGNSVRAPIYESGFRLYATGQDG